jgi:hypothetical protein
MAKISLFKSEVKKAKAQLQERRAVNFYARRPPSRDGSGKTAAAGVKQVQPSSGGAKKLYLKLRARVSKNDKRSWLNGSPVNRQRQLEAFCSQR